MCIATVLWGTAFIRRTLGLNPRAEGEALEAFLHQRAIREVVMQDRTYLDLQRTPNDGPYT